MPQHREARELGSRPDPAVLPISHGVAWRPAADLRLTVNVYLNNGLTIEDVETHWLELLGLERSCLRKHAVDFHPTSSSGRKRHRLPYGVCTIRLQSTRIVQHIFGAIHQYAGFEEPRWLD